MADNKNRDKKNRNNKEKEAKEEYRMIQSRKDLVSEIQDLITRLTILKEAVRKGKVFCIEEEYFIAEITALMYYIYELHDRPRELAVHRKLRIEAETKNNDRT